jgi:hypothetical protein
MTLFTQSHTDDDIRIKDLIRPPSSVMKKRRGSVTGHAEKESALVFPGDLSSHFMAFMFWRYHYDKESHSKSQKLNKTILLPVPINLQEQVQTSYNQAELGAVGGEISDLIAKGNISEVKSKVNSFVTGAGELVSAVAGNQNARERALAALQPGEGGNQFVQAATLGFRSGSGMLAAGLNRYFATAPNPHITALFRGVGLRTHNFSWKLAPASKTESFTLTSIINHMRAAMLPVRAYGNLTLQFPDEVDIFIMGSGEHLYHFKRAVIRNMTTNFAPDGIPSFFAETGAPTAVNITLDLMETTIHTREDYEDVPRQVTEGSVPDMPDSSEFDEFKSGF